ncbi:MMPL family transporter [Miltoncostaea marina]|uniref:MMPL family transporter n=1 Tax=Miltoncostaea marina TaxID=2843215 RepID=UPI001C3CF5E7|nr:MMPL family transporter [Miltoncostaea marina]
MTSIAALAARRPWRIIAVALAVFAVALVVGGPLTGNLTSAGFEDPDAEFVAARDALVEATGANPNPGLIAIVDSDGAVRSPEGRAVVARVARTIAADRDVAGVVTAFNGGGDALVSNDGRASYVAVTFGDIGDDAAEDAAGRIEDALAGEPGVSLGGAVMVGKQAGSIIGEDLASAEMLAFPIIFLLSLWVFRGLVAALLPSLMGGLVIFGSFLAIGLFNEAMTLSVYALNLAIGLSLGLAIDYSLLIISRYREELGVHGPGRDALARTMRTAGKSVLFSAVTVAAALAGLMVFPQRFLFSMGIAGVMVATIAAGVALLVLPAVLALLGGRVNALAPRAWRRRSEQAHQAATSGFWYRLSHAVMRRPAIVASVTAIALVVVALPAAGISFTSVDASVLPGSASARQVADRLDTEFPQDRSTPVYLVLAAPPGEATAAELGAYAERLGALPGAAGATPPQQVAGGAWRIDVFPAESGLAESSQRLVREVRAADAPYPALVGGLSASFVDQKDSIAAHLPWAVGLIAITTIVALFLMTGSVLLPLKAVLMNLLTLGATLGILVWVFQDGRLEGLLDYRSAGAIDLTQPILLGAMAFGLSTDYAVFLLSRIKEAHDAGAGTSDAVALGLQRTGRIVTAAALLFAIAIGAFATSRITLIKELGVGTALAVLIDATIIRALLVPSLMALLGRWNWWAPGPLRRLHDRIGLSEHAAGAAPAAPADAGPGRADSAGSTA